MSARADFERRAQIMISRRDFVHAGCSLAAASLVPNLESAKAAGAEIGKAAPTGKINLGLTGPVEYSNCFAFINLWKSAKPEIFFQNGATRYSASIPKGVVDQYGTHSAYPFYADVNGEIVAPLPAGTSAISRILWINGSLVPPQLAGQQFTVDWTGGKGWKVNVVASGGSLGPLRGSSFSPFTFTWPSTLAEATLVYISISPGSLIDPPRNIRIYKTRFAVGGATGAARLAAGEVVDPDYLSQLADGAGSFRCMDWMSTINNRVTNSFDKIPTEASNFWGVIGSGAPGVRGMPLSVIAKTAIAANKHPWICIPSAMMTPKINNIFSATNATSPVITTFGPHTFADGDVVILNGIPMSAVINPSSYTGSTFTCSAPHGLVNGYPLQLGTTNGQAHDSTTYPSPIVKNTCYYACNVTPLTFQIASTQASALNGASIALSGSISGTINVFLSMNFNRYTVTNSNPSNNTFQITGPGSNTAILSKYTSGGMCMMPYDLTWIATEVGKLAAYFRDNLPAPFVPVYEVDNELWNFGTDVFFNFNGQSRGKFGDNPYQAMAYIQCAFAQAVKTAYHGDRTRYKIVFGGNQMFGDLFGAGLGAGLRTYFTEHGVVGSDLFDYLVGNTYFATSYNPNGSPIAATFHANTIAFSGAKSGWPVKLATTGELPLGLAAGTLGTAGGSTSSSFNGTISGNILMVTGNNGSVSSTISPGATLACPGVVPEGTTIAAYGAGGTTGKGGNGTYRISNSLTVSTGTAMWAGSPFKEGTGTIYWLVGTGPNFGLATSPGGSPLSFSGGSGTHTATRCPTDVVNYLVRQSLALHAGNPATYPTPYSFYNQAISDDCYDARWTAGHGATGFGKHFPYCVKSAIDAFNYYYANYLAPGKLLAGLGQTAYEGGDNNNPQQGFQLINDPTWQAMYTSSQYCKGNADNLAQMEAGVRTVPGGFGSIAQFLDTNTFAIGIGAGNYGAKRYIGDNNLRWQGIVAVNNS
jgi:hypothetical protein